MDPAQLSSIIPLISTARISTYLEACEGDQRMAMRLYAWNMEVSAALLGPLHILEVTMRNSMHQHLSLHFGAENWWDSSRIDLGQHLTTQIRTIHSRKILHARKAGGLPDPNDIVALLGFSFWISLLGKGGKSQFETQLWQPCLRHAFPRFDGTRKELYVQFDYLRSLRNRLAHHEPVFMRHLLADYQSIIALTSTIDETAALFIDSQSRVISVIDKRERAVSLGYQTGF